MLNPQQGINLLVNDIAGVVVVNHFCVLEIPGFCFRAIKGAGRQVIGHDIVIRILLEDLHVIKRITAVTKILHEPGAVIGSVAKNLSFDQRRWPRTGFGEEGLARELGVRSERIV